LSLAGALLAPATQWVLPERREAAGRQVRTAA